MAGISQGLAMFLAGPKLANDYVLGPLGSIYDMYRGIRDDQMQQSDRGQLKKDLQTGDLTKFDLNNYNDPIMALSAREKMQEDVQKRQKLAAQPLESALSSVPPSYGYDPSFDRNEWLQGLNDLGAFGDKGIKPDMTNPYQAKALSDFVNTGRNISNLTSIADSINKNQNADPNILAEFAATGGEKSTNQLKTLSELAKQNLDVRTKQGIQGWVNAGGNSPDVVQEPRLRTVMSSAPYGVTLEDLKKYTDIAGVVPDWKNVDTGTGNGPERQVVTYNPRTGETGKRIGETWKPESTRVNVENKIVPEAVSASIVKAIGPEVMQGVRKGYEDVNKLTSDQIAYKQMLGLLNSGTPTGWGSETAMQARRILSSLVPNKDNSKLNNQQLFESISGLLAQRAVRQTDSNPTQKQIDQVMRRFPGISKERAVNIFQIQSAMNNNSRIIQEHNAKLDGFNAIPGGEAIGGMVNSQFRVKDPALIPTPQEAAAELQKRKAIRGR